MDKSKLDKKSVLRYINEELKTANKNMKDYKKMAIKSIKEDSLESDTNEFLNEAIAESAYVDCLSELKEAIKEGDFY